MALLASEHVGPNRTVRDADERQIVVIAGAGGVAGGNGIADTLGASNTTAAPGALAVLASITAPPAGVYDVDVTIALTGTTETATANVRLRQNAVAISVLPSISAIVYRIRFSRVTVAAGNLDIQAIAAATAGSVYTTSITATRIA